MRKIGAPVGQGKRTFVRTVDNFLIGGKNESLIEDIGVRRVRKRRGKRWSVEL